MKRVFLVLLLSLTVCTGCNNKNSLEICDDLKAELKSNGVEKSQIISLGDFSQLSYEIEEIKLTESELQQAVEDELEMYNELVEYTDKTVVENGDFVTIEYESVCDGEVIDYDSEKVLKVGAGFFDENIEKSLVGAHKGDTYSIVITVPNNVEQWAGKKETTTITVNKIQYMKTAKLTNEFIKKNYNLDSIDLFYNYIRETRETQLKQSAKLETENQIIEKAKQLCSYKLDEDEILKTALKIYEDYSLEKVYLADTLDTSGTIDVYEECYSEAEEKIKYELMLGAIAFEENLTAQGDDFDKYMQDKGVNPKMLSNDEILPYKIDYLKLEARESILNNSMEGD